MDINEQRPKESQVQAEAIRKKEKENQTTRSQGNRESGTRNTKANGTEFRRIIPFTALPYAPYGS